MSLSDEDGRRAFEAEALPHLDSVYRVALRLAGEPAQADDLAQETMLKALRAWHQYQPGTNVRAWLLTILRHTFINEYRRRQTIRRHLIACARCFPQFELERVFLRFVAARTRAQAAPDHLKKRVFQTTLLPPEDPPAD